jgi:biopolymer transport protein ExbD
MAFSFGGSNGGMRGRRFGGASSTLSEINVVPLVDVVLVLLIIFMLTAQAMDFGLEIKVPEVIQVKDTTQNLPVINITRDAKILLGDKPVGIHSMAAEIARSFKGAKAVYVRADKETVYDPIAQVVSTLNVAKYDVMLVTKPLESKR